MTKRKGFTLLELLVVLAVVGSLSVAGVGLFYRSLRGSGQAESLKELEQNSQLVVNILERHIRNARRIEAVGGAACPASGSSLRILGFDGRTTTFTQTADGRIASNGAEISAQTIDVSGLNFDCVRTGAAPEVVIVSFRADYVVGDEVISGRDYVFEVGLRNY